MPIFKLKKDERIETWWRSYYEIEADNLNDAIKKVLDDYEDAYDSEPLAYGYSDPVEIEILDSEENILYHKNNESN